MIHKDKICCCVDSMQVWIESKMMLDPSGRINKSTGMRKSYGAQHTIYQHDDTFRVLFDKINDIAKTKFEKYSITDVWTNVNLPGGKNKKHNHVGANIAGCFYINVPENSGDIEFETGERIAPEVGDIYWWEASIPHFVHVNESKEVRYSVAFNIKDNSPHSSFGRATH